MGELRAAPGPWSRGKYGSIEDANGQTVEATGLALVTGYRNARDPAFANSHLITAAPELYELVDMVFKSIDGGGRVVTFSDDDYEEMRSALTKARGET